MASLRRVRCDMSVVDFAVVRQRVGVSILTHGTLWPLSTKIDINRRGLCDELITHPEESYRLWNVVGCDLETS
jgi:hypothetical protein